MILIFLWFLRREMERRGDRARMLRIRRTQRESEEERVDEEGFEEIPEIDEEPGENLNEMEKPDSETPDMLESEKHIDHKKQTTEEQT